MKSSCRLTIIGLVCIILSNISLAQSTNKPAGELRKLDYFVGTWVVEGEFKDGVMGPSGKITGTDRYEWMPGGYFLALHSDFKSPEEDGAILAIVGYDKQNDIYTYYAFSSKGDVQQAKGTLHSDTWIWIGHARLGGKDTQSRFLVKMLNPTCYSFQFVTSEDGISWTTVLEGKANKVK